MTFDPTLADATSRVRLFIGDTGDTPTMPGGTTTYTALAADYTADEPGYAKAAATALRAALAVQPTQVGEAGASVAWANRLRHLDDIISGKVRYPWATGGTPGGSLRGLFVGGQDSTGAGPEPMFRRDSLGTEPVLERLPGDSDAEDDDDDA